MATSAVARETVFALRREIARIEGMLPDRLDEEVVLRGSGRVIPTAERLATGVPALDEALGGGIAKGALTEIHGRQMRDAGTVAGFALALVSLLVKQASAQEAPAVPLLWIGACGLFAETGFPYAHGLAGLFGIQPQDVLFAEAPKPVDALWIAEEAAALKTLAAVILELPGNPSQLDLTATRRLHRRAIEAGRPVFLLRHSAEAEPTAAPLRFVVRPAPAGLRRILGRPLEGSIGPPAFAVDLDKNALSPPASFILEWNGDERTLHQRATCSNHRPEDSVGLVSLSRNGTDMAAAAGPRMALDARRFSASGH